MNYNMKTESFIIFLEGVNPSDYVEMEDDFEQKLLDDIESIDDDINIIYSKIPNVFKSFDTWVKQTNLKCWCCDFTFDTMPIFIPIYMHANTCNSIEMGTKGNFCSFNCACSYIIQHNMDDFYTYLIHLYKYFTGKKIYQIIPSPPKTNMIKYGGWLTDIEYINIIASLEKIQHGASDFQTENLITREIHCIS
jgi:hypothetical protein